MNVKNALDSALNSLPNRNRARLECEILLAFVLKKPRIFLHANDDFMLNKSQESRFFKLVSKLANHYPIEYLTKCVSFYDYHFFIDVGALIPRSESEILLLKCKEMVEQFHIKKAYEIGTGSGILAITLAILCPNLEIIATDISPNALKIAEKNLDLKAEKFQELRLKKRIRFKKTNLLDKLNWDKNALIFSNPPYIATTYQIPPNLAYEPKIALFGGKNGDEILKQIIALDSAFLACEIGYNQGYLKDFLTSYKSVEFYKDLSGFTRGFVAKK